MSRKLAKLQAKWEEVRNGLRDVKKKILDISRKADKADQFFLQAKT